MKTEPRESRLSKSGPRVDLPVIGGYPRLIVRPKAKACNLHLHNTKIVDLKSPWMSNLWLNSNMNSSRRLVSLSIVAFGLHVLSCNSLRRLI